MNTSSEDFNKLMLNMCKAILNYQSAYLQMFGENAEQSLSCYTKQSDISDTFSSAWNNFYSNTELANKSFSKLWDDYGKLYQNIAEKFQGNNTEEIFSSTGKDSRFKDEAWNKNPYFNLLKQSYFLQAQWLQKIVHEIPALDKQQRKILEFYTNQYIDAISPTNFLFTNPTALDTMHQSNGKSIVDGSKQFIQDVQNGRISTVDDSLFEVGKNIASTPGEVVFQNDLFQLIQYKALTAKVHQKPILICTAWINKYYILDLQTDFSFVRWLVEQGFTVFMISWVNPDASMKDKTFTNYLEDGVLTAISEVQKITQESKIHCLGYCLGGTLLATAIAYLKAQNKECLVSATFMTTLLDFEECGTIGAFISENQIKEIEEIMAREGVLDGNKMAATFSMLRSKDMIWSFWVNNYLLGKKPAAFDILYWNADPTNLPAAMHSYYLRNMYLNNNLIQGKIKINNVSIDLKNIDIPTYSLATLEDHIAPWKSAFKVMSNIKGKRVFVLTASGHVAGVTNHPARDKYSYWTNDQKGMQVDVWFSKSTEHKGSWWLNWRDWVKPHLGEMIDAREVKNSIEQAPGSYVKKRIAV